MLEVIMLLNVYYHFHEGSASSLLGFGAIAVC